MSVIVPYINDIKHAYANNISITNPNMETEFYQSLTYELDALLYDKTNTNEIKDIVENIMNKYKKYIHTDFPGFFEQHTTLTNKSILKYYGR